MLSKITALLTKNRAALSADSKTQEQSVSVWEDTGQVYYLENTLKLTYQAKCGEIVMEKLNIKDLPSILADIERIPENSPLSRAVIAEQRSVFSLSLCAVTWQKKQDSTRIKAIPQAATLRSPTHCFSRSQAVFRHACLLEHDDLLSPSTHAGKEGVFTYNRISVEQFTTQITNANKRLGEQYRKAISVNPENFDTAFTQNEQNELEKLINLAPSNKSISRD
jgi:hypothetical protein